tara:strand:+ start:122 stop:637 length:516 start_codon:yes stop_codon:yes gene_type:complete
MNTKKILSLILFSLFLASCATSSSNMYIKEINNLNLFNETIKVSVIGGKQGRVESLDYEMALKDALLRSGLVNNLDSGSSLTLNVQILSLKEPMFGGAFTVTMRSLWILKSTNCDAIRKQISSEYTATMSDQIIGAARLNLAVEGAVRNNIKDGMNFISLEGKKWREEQCT